MEELTIDREFDELCPALSDDEERLLEQSLLADGCLHSIIAWANNDDTVLDGHNRYRLCKKHGIKFHTKRLKIDSRDEAKAWIITQQIGRRNLSATQRASLAAKLVNSHVGRPNSATLQNLMTTEKAAEKFDVSERLVATAAKVHEKGSAALVKAMDADEIPASTAAAIIELPKSEQTKLVQKGPEAVKAAVKKVRAKKQKASDEPKKWEDDFDAAKLTGESKDAFGNEVAAELAQAFELRNGFKEQRDKLTSIKSWMTQNLKHPGAVILAGAQQRIITDIDQADRELKFSAPHCVCIYCKNKSPKVANCNACKGTGWVNESVYKAAPKGMR